MRSSSGPIAFVLAVILAGTLACSTSTREEPFSLGEGGGGGGETGAGGAGGAGGSGDGCASNNVTLLVDEAGGVPARLHVPVGHEDVDGLLLFDTGSALTFLALGEDDPAYVENAGAITLGCDTFDVPGRGKLASFGSKGGLPVVGILGNDYVTAGTTHVDTVLGRLLRHPPGTEIDGTAGWSKLSYEDEQGHAVAPVVLDGKPVRLMFDTGAQHTLWLGEGGKPGDQEVKTTDAEGNEITLYYGQVLLEMAGEEPVTVPVLRAPSFPYLEKTVEALGGNIHGLLGLSALRARPWIFDGAEQSLRIQPPKEGGP